MPARRPSAAYRKFLDATRSPNTRRVYRSHIRRFCRWAEGRGLALEAIAVGNLAAYAASIEATMAPGSATIYLTAVRGLFHHLIGARVAPEPLPVLAPGDPPRGPRRRSARLRSTVPLAELQDLGAGSTTGRRTRSCSGRPWSLSPRYRSGPWT